MPDLFKVTLLITGCLENWRTMKLQELMACLQNGSLKTIMRGLERQL